MLKIDSTDNVMPVELIPIAGVELNLSPRVPTESAVAHMAASLSDIGQLSPVGVIKKGNAYSLLYGNTRVLAAKSCGWQGIMARIYPPDTKPEDCVKMAVCENTVRDQMSFAELYDALSHYSKLTKLSLAEAGMELGFKQSQISKCLKTNERLTPRNQKKLLEAGIGGSTSYLISQESSMQDQLVDAVVEGKWSRKKVEQYFRQKRKGGVRFEFRHKKMKLTVDVPKTSTADTVLELLKNFASNLKKCANLNLTTAARVIKEQSNVVA